MERFRETCKWILYGAVLILVFFVSVRLRRTDRIAWRKAGLSAVFVVCIAFLEGAKPGAVMGIAAGVLCGAVTNLGALYSLLYFAAGYAAGYLAETRLRTNFLTVLLFALLLDVLCVLSARWRPPSYKSGRNRCCCLPNTAGTPSLRAAGAIPLYPLLKGIRRLSDPATRRDRRARYRI